MFQNSAEAQAAGPWGFACVGDRASAADQWGFWNIGFVGGGLAPGALEVARCEPAGCDFETLPESTQWLTGCARARDIHARRASVSAGGGDRRTRSLCCR